MSITVKGAGGVLTLLACLAFLAATIVAWVAPGHRLYYALIGLGLFLWALTGILK